jgi:hypothetical protein
MTNITSLRVGIIFAMLGFGITNLPNISNPRFTTSAVASRLRDR